ncbi:hypothetical protein BV20DRAFT_175681 [Pilatotrama ljubarskyi]|nr:hypothetical protein BV20DRAFT_175681 [Pilatotrama ljubarskyi]
MYACLPRVSVVRARCGIVSASAQTSTTTKATTTMSATAPTPEAAAQLLFPPNVQYNSSRVYTVKFLSSCFAGAAAGVLGLENSLGFALFILSTLFTSACLYVKCNSRPAKYIPGGWWELVNPGQENIFSFVLVWTLFYGTPHLLFLAVTDLLEAVKHRYRARYVCSNM